MKKNSYSVGPAAMVTAAFVGPGTVTACTLAGAQFGHALLWALLFSVVTCMLLQEMSARLGVAGRLGLGEALRQQLRHPVLRWTVFTLVTVAILIGNGAYQGGNITGAALGLQALSPAWLETRHGAWLIGLGAFVLLFGGSHRLIERVLIALVVLMSVIFLVTFFMLKPDPVTLAKGFVPRVPEGAWLSVVALIGTTVVPYNLFLHASAARLKWPSEQGLPAARRDIVVSIGLGGLLSMAIVSVAATAFFQRQIEIRSALDMSIQLQPLLGAGAPVFLGIGLFAAGLTSAITAPLAAAHALCGLAGWSVDMRAGRFRLIWVAVLLVGVVLASLGLKPIRVIFFAQIANGVLLPLMAAFLLWVMNTHVLPAKHRNRWWHNLAGAAVIAVALLLGARSVASALGWLS